MAFTPLHHCLILKELMEVKGDVLIKTSNDVSCLEVKVDKTFSLNINKALLDFIKDEAGTYVLDLLLTYKLHSPKSTNENERALNIISGLYGVYKRALKLNSLYNDLYSIVKAKKVLKQIYECLNYREARLISSLLDFNTFEKFIDKLSTLNEFKNLRAIIHLLKGRSSLQFLLNFLEDIDINSIDILGYYILASMIVQEMVVHHKVNNQEIKRLLPFVNLIDNIIGGGLKELVKYISSSPNNEIREELSSLFTLLDTINIKRYNYNIILDLYIKPRLRKIIDLSRASPENILSIVRAIINTVRFCFYYELYERGNLYIPLLDTLLDKEFIERLAYITSEHIVSKRTSLLYTKLSMKPIIGEEFKESHNIAIIFGSFRGFFKNLLWDLEKDAEEYRLSKGFKVKVIGVLFNWLTADHGKLKARRALIPRKDHIDETTFVESIPIHSCFILNLPINDERNLHKRFSRALEECEIILINPYVASMRADDKLLTHWLFETYNNIIGKRLIEHPRYVYIQRDSYTLNSLYKILNLLKRYNIREIIVKPIHGTEGLYVKYFDLKEDTHEILKHINRILKFDDVIIEEIRGNLLYKGKLHFVIRVNVSWNGKEFKVESGYSQVSSKEGYKIATVSHGGKIVNINELFRHLYFKSRNGRIKKYFLTRKDINRIKDTCIEVAKAINLGLCERDYLKYMGIDLVLELKEQKIVPVVLEVNSRPSGLSYSYTLSYNYESSLGEANVIKNLIKYLEMCSLTH